MLSSLLLPYYYFPISIEVLDPKGRIRFVYQGNKIKADRHEGVLFLESRADLVLETLTGNLDKVKGDILNLKHKVTFEDRYPQRKVAYYETLLDILDWLEG